MQNSKKYIVGIDEAGRGPLAGPVAVGACVVSVDFDFKVFENLKDSKKLSPKRREEIFLIMKDLKKKGQLDFAVALVSSSAIDTVGIVSAIRNGMEGVINKLQISHSEVLIKLDGGLKAPAIYEQETIIKGDELVPAISLASIAAKVTRDNWMDSLAKKLPEYGFEVHKGYGTKAHLEAILTHGLSEAHRRSFCKRFL